MLKAFGRSTSGIHARPRKMVRFCCSVKPSQLWWGLPHPHHQLDFPHYPSKIANTLASLVKGEVLSPEKIRATTGGIASPPSLRTTFLPPLVKGRWIDGKAQAFILLLSACATSAFFIHQTFLPSRRRDCYIPSPHTNPRKTALSHSLFVL